MLNVEDSRSLLERHPHLMKRSVFSHFSEKDVRQHILPVLRLERFNAAAEITRTPQPNRVYIVAEGQVGQFLDDASAGVIFDGRSLELGAVLGREPKWKYRWRAVTDCTVLSIPREVIDRLLSEDPRLKRYLTRMVAHRELQKLRHDLLLLGFSQPDIRTTLCELQEVELEQLIESSPESMFVIVRSGELQFSSDGRLNRYQAGDYFPILETPDENALQLMRAGQAWAIDLDHWAKNVSPELVANVLGIFSTSDNPYGVDIARSENGTDEEQEHADEDAHESADEEEETDEDGEEAEEADDETLEASDDEDEDDEDGFEIDHFEVEASEAKAKTRYPFVRQHDEMDCGAACLAMVTRSHGKNLSVARLRGLLNVSTDGTSIGDLVEAATFLGIDSIGVEAELDSMKELQLPAIALMEYHFVTVHHVSETHVTVGDPGVGQMTLTHEDFLRGYSGFAALFKPTEKFAELPEDKFALFKYRSLVNGHGADFLRLGIVVATLFALGLLYPLFMQLLFDEILAQGKIGLVKLFFAGFIALSAFRVLTETVRDYLFVNMAAKIDSKISSLFIKHALSLPLRYFSLRRTGDFVSRLRELQNVQSFLTGRPLVLAVNVLSIVVYALALFFYHPVFIAIIGVGLPLYVFVVARFSRVLQDLMHARFKNMARAESRYVESITHIETIRALDGAIAARWRWENELAASLRTERQIGRALAFFNGASGLLEYVFNGLILLAAAYLFTTGRLSMGQVIAVTAIGTQLLGPAIALLNEWKSVSELAVSLEKIDDVFISESERPKGPAQRQAIQGKIEFRDVSFRHGGENSPLILRGINLVIEPGETVAFVGTSGSGKTTLACMANLLYKPSAGEVLIDGTPSGELDLEHLRRQVAMIMQDSQLLTGTVLENIALGDESPSMERAVEAAKIADAHEFIAKMTGGYRHPLTAVGEISGGERQRLNIARAFYSKPRVLIMDEATSALDSISESRILKNIERSNEKITTLVIAHRLNSVTKADRIVVLEDGTIVEQGTHQSLMQARGPYYRLFRKQLSA